MADVSVQTDAALQARGPRGVYPAPLADPRPKSASPWRSLTVLTHGHGPGCLSYTHFTWWLIPFLMSSCSEFLINYV